MTPGTDEKRCFVLDTNILLHSPNSLFAFHEHDVVLPIAVLEELDRFKTDTGELGRNAREVVRVLDRLRTSGGNLTEGVSLTKAGGSLRIDLHAESLADQGLDRDTADHRILSVARRLQREGGNIVFVSKDISLRLKASALGITAEDFLRQKVQVDKLHPGWREMLVSSEDIRSFYDDGELSSEGNGSYPNEGILLRDKDRPKRTALGRRSPSGSIRPLERGTRPCFGLTARNLEQRLALEMLLDHDIQLVALIGKAGTGKTLLALAAGLQMVLNEKLYDRVLVARPIMPLGKDLGYLPGGVKEKLEPWMKPVFDNLQFLFSQKGRDPGEVKRKSEDLIRTGRLDMEALAYIRGRSIHNHFLIIDECQNLTPHEVKTIISRAGENTKIVLAGDPYQIDNPYLDSESNGLIYVAERMKGLDMVAHVMLSRTERSSLASIAADVL